MSLIDASKLSSHIFEQACELVSASFLKKHKKKLATSVTEANYSN